MSKLREEIKCAIQNPLRDLEDKSEWIETIANNHAIKFNLWMLEKYRNNEFVFFNSDKTFYYKSKVITADKLLKIYNENNEKQTLNK